MKRFVAFCQLNALPQGCDDLIMDRACREGGAGGMGYRHSKGVLRARRN